MLIATWFAFLAFFVGSYVIYFGYLKLHANQPWGLEVNPNFCPSVVILVPFYNEEAVIVPKMENLAEIAYPRDKMDIVLIDDGSTDESLTRITDFIKKHPWLPIRVIGQYPRKGKANALNEGLRASSGDPIVVTDADTLWVSDTLNKILSYMFDSRIGAVSGIASLKNTDGSWVTRTETDYMDLMALLRVGESKIHSSLRFEGCVCAFKRNSFDKFDNESGADDSGTALKVVQNNFRAIVVPEASATAQIPHSYKVKIRVKMRRAVHLTGLWLRCLKLLLAGSLRLPKRIAIPEIILFTVDPIIFAILFCLTFIVIFYYPILLIPLLLVLCPIILISKTRSYFVDGMLDQFILLYSLIARIRKKKFVIWEK